MSKNANDSLNYQFLLLTHVVCADGQIHSEETKALRELAQVAEINDLTLQEMEKILAQEINHLSVEAIADQIPHHQQVETMRQVLAIAYIDGYFSSLEYQLVDQIRQFWHWTTQDLDILIQEAQGFQGKSFVQNEEDQLSFAARLLKNEQKSLLSRAIIDFAAKIAPDTIGQTVKKLEREILLSGPEYDEAIAQCARIAQEDDYFTHTAFHNADCTLRKLADNLGKVIVEIQAKNKHQNQAKTAKEVAKQLEISKNALMTEIIKNLENVRQSFHAKKRALNHFSIAFMGKTKAGKSTLHAIITGEGWDAIGVGKQRTTRLNRVYEWKNIRIIDTPGIGAPGGKSDEEIAKSVIDESDVICYVVTNNNIQETEFQFMKLLKDKAKPLIILLNIKNNLRDSRRLEHFLKNPEKFFAREGNNDLKGHFDRIYRYAQQYYANDYFAIIPVMLLSAQMANEPEYQKLNKKLFQASKIQDFLDSIRESLIKYGAIRRSQTLLGSTVGEIDYPLQWVKQQKTTYQEITNTLIKKRQEIQAKIRKAEDDNLRWLKSEIKKIFASANNNIQKFAEENWDANEHKLNSAWQKKLNFIKFEEKLKEAYEEAIEQFNKNVKEIMEEIGTELKLIAELNNISGFRLDAQDNDLFDWQKGLQIFGAGLMVIGALATVFFPPLAPLFIIGGGIVSMFTGWFKSKEQKRREAVDKITRSLSEQLNNHEREVMANQKANFTDFCHSVSKYLDQYFDELIQGLQEITNNLEQTKKELNQTSDYLNRAYAKRILDWCLDQYEPLNEQNILNTIAKVERDFGKLMKIKPRQPLQIKKTPSEIKQVLQEDVVFEINQY